MKKIFQPAKFCFGLLSTAILFAASLQSVAAQNAETVVSNAPSAVCGQFSVKNSSFYKTSRTPLSLVTADFNNDDIPDIAAPMPDTNNIAVALGDNQNGFGATREFVAGVSPQHAIAGDFNRDGEIDLAVTSKFDRQINILLGDGSGNFTLTDSFPVGADPERVVTADLNNDGWLDLVTGNLGGGGFSVYLGGAGGFVAANPATVLVNGSPEAFAVSDFNRDGKSDLITLAQNDFSTTYIRLLNGDGQGAFTETVTITIEETYSLVSADFNNDNYPDFATMGYRDSKLRVYLNNRSGGFNAPLESNPTFNYYAFLPLYAADLNGDGQIDLTTDGVIWLNDGSGNFTIRERNGAPGGELAIADFNGDGIVDIAAAGGINSFFGSEVYSSFTVNYGLGELKYTAPTYLDASHGASTSVVTADFNNDGRQDVATVTPYQHRVLVSLQNEDGTFSVVTPAAFVNGGTGGQRVLTAGDFNSDGNVDLIAYIPWAYSLYVLTNDGSAKFTASQVRLVFDPYGYQPQYVQTGEFNNDGKPDLVIIASSFYIIALNDGNGGFTLLNPVSLNASNEQATVAVGDFDGDGKNDLAISRGSLSLWIMKGKGDGTFTGSGSYVMPFYINTMRAGDLNGDGKDDLVAVPAGELISGTPNLAMLMSNSSGGFTQNNRLLPGAPNDIAFGDFNGDSVKDYLVNNSPYNSVTLFAGNGSGSYAAQPSVYTFTNSGYSAVAAADFNRDQKLDFVLVSGQRSGAVFYNNLPKSPCLSVNDAQVTEGDSGTANAQFTVTLSAATQTVSVDYRAVGRSARENSDFNAAAGKLEFAPGTLTKTVTIPVRGDTADEIDETFQLVLSNPVNASLIDNIGVAIIADNDAAPSVSVGDVTISEGTGGNPTQLIFNAALSAPTGRKAKVEFATADETAIDGGDYKAAAGTIVFNEGEAMQQIVVEIAPDAFVEPDETFKIKLSNSSNLSVADGEATATIVNDDVGGTVQFEIAVLETSEENDAVVVKVARTGGNAAGIILDYATSDGTAKANRDYLPSSGRLIFGANETQKTFTIPILDDAIDENLETINLTLSGISGGAAFGGQSTAVLNIADDDPMTALAVGETRINEGNGGTTTLDFNVRLLAVSEQTVRVNFATENGTAISSEDYSSIAGSLVFAPGETSKIVSVAINGDQAIEPDETFFLKLSAPENAVLQNAQAIGIIVNDDLNARRAAIADFDGDGKTDVAVFRPTGFWFYSQSSDDIFKAVQFGTGGDRIAPGDFDGDGKTDIAVFRPSNGTWYILESLNSSFRAVQFGVTEDKPVAGDYDGDGKTDIAVFRPSTGGWYVLRSSDNSFSAVQWGVSEDKPVPADYDGDGKTDVAVFRPSNGNWYRLNSSDDQFVAFHFGVAEDKPVPADYDGDGKDDVAVYRPSTGSWYVEQSRAGFTGVRWGVAADQPAPGDYDGDGKADFAVFRAENGNWYVNQSSGAQRAIYFGANTDLAVSGGYFPN